MKKIDHKNLLHNHPTKEKKLDLVDHVIVDRPEWELARDILQKTDERTMRQSCMNIICICGSMRFIEDITIKAYELQKQGNIVLSSVNLPDAYKKELEFVEGEREMIDQAHLAKIDLADEILIFNKGGYVGMHTMKEMAYALTLKKKLHFEEPINILRGEQIIDKIERVIEERENSKRDEEGFSQFLTDTN